jgi:leucyl aminopeptidase
MNTKITKSALPDKDQHIVILADTKSKFKSVGFTKEELSYLEKEIKKQDKKLIPVNQYNRWVFVQILDKKKEGYLMLESCRKAGDQMASLLNKHGLTTITILDEGVEKDNILAYTEGMALGNYQFLKYKTTSKKANSLKNIHIYNPDISAKKIERLQILVDATLMARDLVNEPVSFLTAEQLAIEFELLGKMAGFNVSVFNKAKIIALKMGGLLSVNQGSIDPPTFTVMEWKPKNAINKKPIILIGKGVVYDTGGLSLKPTTNSMDFMKCDMAGGAAVGCAMYAIAKAELPVYVIAMVPATDNRPGENAFAPGDVITMFSGQTVEMLNSDAEGRMILADALSYAKKYNPKLVLDFATLTGAAAAAVGHFGIVCMGTADEKTKNQLKKSGEQVYERLAEFPFWDEYDELIKSDIADMKNTGGAFGGAITAGKFLQRFVDYPWMHFDIAAPAYVKTANSYRGQNGTGVGVRLLFDFIENQKK